MWVSECVSGLVPSSLLLNTKAICLLPSCSPIVNSFSSHILSLSLSLEASQTIFEKLQLSPWIRDEWRCRARSRPERSRSDSDNESQSTLVYCCKWERLCALWIKKKPDRRLLAVLRRRRQPLRAGEVEAVDGVGVFETSFLTIPPFTPTTSFNKGQPRPGKATVIGNESLCMVICSFWWALDFWHKSGSHESVAKHSRFLQVSLERWPGGGHLSIAK